MHQYTMDAQSIDNKFIHLTNAAIQKDSTETADTIRKARCGACAATRCCACACVYE